MSKLIVIDGLDSSGKETQTALLEQKLSGLGKEVKRLSFPNYSKDYSIPVKMYLAGQLGKDAGEVNPYGASTLYAADRFCSYKTEWEQAYKQGAILLCDRYTTSNAIHQGSKLTGRERKDYFAWLYDFEFGRIKLPKPDCVVFLDMPPNLSLQLMKNRNNKATGKKKKDIHEADKKYLTDCYETAKEAAAFYGWSSVSCTDVFGTLRAIEDIHEEIFEKIKNIL